MYRSHFFMIFSFQIQNSIYSLVISLSTLQFSVLIKMTEIDVKGKNLMMLDLGVLNRL